MRPTARGRPATLGGPAAARAVADGPTTSASGSVTAMATTDAAGQANAGVTTAVVEATIGAGVAGRREPVRVTHEAVAGTEARASAEAAMLEARGVVRVRALVPTRVHVAAMRTIAGRAAAGQTIGGGAVELRPAGSVTSGEDARVVDVPVVVAATATTTVDRHPGATIAMAVRPAAEDATIGHRAPRAGVVGRTRQACESAVPRARPGATWPGAVRPTSGTVAVRRPHGGLRVRRPVRDHGVRATARGVPCPGPSTSPRW